MSIGDGTVVGNYVTIEDGTAIGNNCQVYHNSSIGCAPQDLKYDGEPTKLIIGNNVLIRESCTLNRGTAAYGTTEIGDNCLLMAYVHVAHDCKVEDNVILANQATLGGHSFIGEWASLGGGVLLHQFCRVGEQAFVGGGFRITQDVPPYILAAGVPLRYAGINRVGLQRRGFSQETRESIKHAYRLFFRSKLPRREAVEEMKKISPRSKELDRIITFIESSDRSII